VVKHPGFHPQYPRVFAEMIQPTNLGAAEPSSKLAQEPLTPVHPPPRPLRLLFFFFFFLVGLGFELGAFMLSKQVLYL
jgi:hypothetical protein